jgi:hypothetical protein
MRNGNLDSDAHSKLHPQFRKYWLALEYKRTDMMIRLAEPGDEQRQLEVIRGRYGDLLIAEAVEAERERLLMLVERMNGYQPGDAQSEAVFEEIFNEIMAQPYDERTAASA